MLPPLLSAAKSAFWVPKPWFCLSGFSVTRVFPEILILHGIVFFISQKKLSPIDLNNMLTHFMSELFAAKNAFSKRLEKMVHKSITLILLSGGNFP